MSTTLMEKKKKEQERDDAAIERNLINVLRCDSKNTTAVKRAIVARLGDPAKELLGEVFRKRGLGEHSPDTSTRGDFVTQGDSLWAVPVSRKAKGSQAGDSPVSRPDKSTGEMKGIRHAVIDNLSRVRSGVGKQSLMVDA